MQIVARAALLSLIALPCAAIAPQDELDSLAEAFAGYLRARAEGEDLAAELAALDSQITQHANSSGGENALARPRDLQLALTQAVRPPETGAKPGKVEKDVFRGGSFRSDGLEYAFRLPKSYDAEAGGHTLILSIPNQGQTPAGHLRESWTHRDLLDGAILFAPAMPAEQGVWSRVMVDGKPGGLVHVLTGLRVALERFAVAADRVFVAGRGKAVPAAIAAGNYAPQRFAGVLGRSGDAGELGPDNFSNLPTWFSGAGARATAFEQAAQAAGFDNCTLLPSGTEADAWNWISSTRRHSLPDQVTVVPGDPFPTRAYWLRIAPNASDARVTATIEREDNHVRIEGSGASQAVLYLNDDLLDLDRPVRLTAANVERDVRVERRLSTTLDLWTDGTSDRACVYTAELVVDLAQAVHEPAKLDEALVATFEERWEAAQGDPEALLELSSWCSAKGLEQQSLQALRSLLRAAPEHEAARAALGHVRAGEHWLHSQEALRRWNDGQDPAQAASRGRVEAKGLWVHPDQREWVGKRSVLDPNTGLWSSRKQQKLLAEGWVRHDLDWIEPDDASLVDAGLFPVEGEWLPVEEANRRHARVDNMWRIPGGEILVHATADRQVALRAMTQMTRALDDLRRVFGVEPALPLEVCVLRDEEQYDRFAFGAPDGSRSATHQGRLQVVHSAYLAESWFVPVGKRASFRGMGVCYWDPLVPGGDLYGVHSARLAAGLSYVDAIDASPKTVRKAESKGPAVDHMQQYMAEKALPMWLRYGGPVFAERYFEDERVGADGDPQWARRWSLENLNGRGGLRPLSEVLAFELDPDDPEDGLKLLIEAGLVVAFMLDGECAPVSEAHVELKRALVGRRLHARDVRALEEALLAHEGQLRAWAQL